MTASSILTVNARTESCTWKSIPRDQFVAEIVSILDDVQNNLYQKALAFRKKHTRVIDNREEFDDYFRPQQNETPEIHGGFALAPWCGSEDCEARLKDDLGVSIRCLPFEGDLDDVVVRKTQRCVACQHDGAEMAVFAKAY